MCPLCLTTLVVTIAAVTGGGAVMTALAGRITRAIREAEEPSPNTPGASHEELETDRQP
jgi:hypothetical protein